MAVHRRERGQASVELVALLPLAALVALAIGQLLAAGSARELAATPPRPGRRPAAGHRPDRGRSRCAPGWSRERTTVRVAGGGRGHVRPRTVVPLLAERLEASTTADAGPP